MAKASVLIVQGPGQGTRFEFAKPRVHIGRGPENDVCILDDEVSRTHALIDASEEGFELRDHGSANGTLLNGRQVERSVLADGDQLQIGGTLLLFRVTDPPPKSPGVPVDLVSEETDRSSIVSQVTAEEPVRVLEADHESGGTESESFASLAALYRITEEISRPASTSVGVLQGVLDVALDVVGADRGCVLLVEPENGDVVPAVFSYHGEPPGGTEKMLVPRSIVEVVMRDKGGVRTSNALLDDRFQGGQSILSAGVREAVCAPLMGREELLGVIYLDTSTAVSDVLEEKTAAERFSDNSLRLLVAIGRQAALAVDGQRYQSALVKAERLAAVGQTIATLSHHVKNILQGVRGGSYLINLGLEDRDDQLIRKGWGIVDRNQERIYELVMDMLTYSTDRVPAWQEVQVNGVVGDACEMLQVRAEEGRVELACDVSADVTVVECDPDAIHRAVLNVVINAIDAVEGQPGARVDVSTGVDQDSGWVFVDVHDNGPGIPSDQLSRSACLLRQRAPVEQDWAWR